MYLLCNRRKTNTKEIIEILKLHWYVLTEIKYNSRDGFPKEKKEGRMAFLLYYANVIENMTDELFWI